MLATGLIVTQRRAIATRLLLGEIHRAGIEEASLVVETVGIGELSLAELRLGEPPALEIAHIEVRYSAATEVALGGATGVFTALAICPFEVLKVRQQVQSESGLLHIVRQLVREDGYGGFYRGLASVMCRDVVRLT